MTSRHSLLKAWRLRIARLEPAYSKLLRIAGFILFVATLTIALVSFGRLRQHEKQTTIRVSAGDVRGSRNALMLKMRDALKTQGLSFLPISSQGSEDSLRRLEQGEIDLALVQGGLSGSQHPRIREVAAFEVEALHILVSETSGVHSIEGIRAHTANLAPPGSGTRQISLAVLDLANIAAHDIRETNLDYQQLEQASSVDLPDVVFHVSPLPSPVADRLLHVGYRLLPLDAWEALRLRHPELREATIPSATYGLSPRRPTENLRTVGAPMLAVVRADFDEGTVKRLLTAWDSGAFLRSMHFSEPLERRLGHSNFALHQGAQEWLRRNDPLLTPEWLEGIESVRSFLFSLAVASFLAARWWRKQRHHGFDVYLAEVSRIEGEALQFEQAAELQLSSLLKLRRDLGSTKARALAAFADGKLHSDELLSSFLTHVADVRSHLNAMILHERSRLERQARNQHDESAEQAFESMWKHAMETSDPESRVPHDGSLLQGDWDEVQ